MSGIDQYIGVIHALQYHRHMTRKRSNLSVALAWTFSLLAAVTITLLLNLQANLALISLLNVVHTVPCLLLTVIYCKIFRAAHTSSERARRNSAVRKAVIT